MKYKKHRWEFGGVPFRVERLSDVVKKPVEVKYVQWINNAEGCPPGLYTVKCVDTVEMTTVDGKPLLFMEYEILPPALTTKKSEE